MTQESYFAYAGRAPRVIATRVVALYDGTGRIRHSHIVHIHQGGRDVPEHEAIEAAHRHARQLGHDTTLLKVKTSTQAAHGHFPHAVDLKSGEFTAISKAPQRTKGWLQRVLRVLRR
jgi:hypothetical protein